MAHKFKVIIEHNEDEGGYTVTVPALPGCITEGETVEEALENVKEAIAGFLEAMQIQGRLPPAKDSELLFAEVEIHDAPAPWSKRQGRHKGATQSRLSGNCIQGAAIITLNRPKAASWLRFRCTEQRLLNRKR